MTGKPGQRMNPRSLANLRPFPRGEAANKNGKQGPLVTPWMRHYADWSLQDLEALWAKAPKTLKVGEAIAITALIDALKTKASTTGARSRELVMDRLDGAAPKVAVGVEVNVGVVLTWSDGTEA